MDFQNQNLTIHTKRRSFLWNNLHGNLCIKMSKKNFKINFLYLSRTLPRPSDRLHMFFTHVLRAFLQHLAVIRSSPQHPAASLRTSFIGVLVCRGELRIKAECCGKLQKKGWCCSNLKYWWSRKCIGARKICWCAENKWQSKAEILSRVSLVHLSGAITIDS